MAYSKNPKWPIISGVFGILIYLISQFSQPFIFNFKLVEGTFIKYSILEDKDNSANEIVNVWISDYEEPFINKYPGSYKELLDNINNLKNQKITIWYSGNQEIRQLKFRDNLLIQYDWFNPLLLIILGIGISFQWVAYREMKEKCTNIKTICDMYDYVWGGRELIMKYNDKPYNPKNLWNF